MPHFRFHSHSFAAFPLRKGKNYGISLQQLFVRKLLDVALFPGSFVRECNIGKKKGIFLHVISLIGRKNSVACG